MNREEYLQSEKKQKLHRVLNTTLAAILFLMFALMVNPVVKSTKDLYEKVSGLEHQRIITSELAQIVADEGYVPRPYKDSRGLWTIGFGHLIKEGESFGKISPHEAVRMLRKDYSYATKSVEDRYPWAEGEVKLVLVNMTYQMGEHRVAKFKKTLSYLKSGKYDMAAGEMLDSIWADQTPLRASRLAGRIMQLGE